MTIHSQHTGYFQYNFSQPPLPGRSYRCATKHLRQYTLVQKIGRTANGSACIERGVTLREGQFKKLLRKHVQKHGYRPKPQGGGYMTFYI